MNSKPDVFRFSDYKKLLKEHAKSQAPRRGYFRELAEAAGCQRSYFSSVLHTHNHLTPDHACALAAFWNLNSSETDYFLALVDLARAGTTHLQQRLRAKLTSLRKDQEDISRRLERPQVQSAGTEELIYYSTWVYSAIHILVSIEEFQDLHAISTKLNLPLAQVTGALAVLKSMKLIEEFKPGFWRHSSPNRHVPRGSPLVALHHNNWRQKAVLDSQAGADSEVHFTTVTAMSDEAYKKIKELVLKCLEDCNRIAEPSAPKVLVCMNLDLFFP